MVGLTRAVALLERAVDYGLESLTTVTAATLTRPTPCGEWDQEALLCHVNESLAALAEGPGGCIALTGPVAHCGPPARRAQELTGAMRDSARRLLDGWHSATADASLRIGPAPLAPGTVALTGAVEIAVHGWDIAESCGHHRPIPVRLALDLLRLAPLLVDTGRRPLFAPPVRVPPLASPSDRLVGFLGRNPRAWSAPSPPVG